MQKKIISIIAPTTLFDQAILEEAKVLLKDRSFEEPDDDVWLMMLKYFFAQKGIAHIEDACLYELIKEVKNEIHANNEVAARKIFMPPETDIQCDIIKKRQHLFPHTYPPHKDDSILFADLELNEPTMNRVMYCWRLLPDFLKKDFAFGVFCHMPYSQTDRRLGFVIDKKHVCITNNESEHVILHEFIHLMIFNKIITFDDFSDILKSFKFRAVSYTHMEKIYTIERFLRTNIYNLSTGILFSMILPGTFFPMLLGVSLASLVLIFYDVITVAVYKESHIENYLKRSIVKAFSSLNKWLLRSKNKESKAFPTTYSMRSPSEFICELLTNYVLYGDVYRELPEGSALYNAYRAVKGKIMRDIEFTRDTDKKPVILKNAPD